MAQYSVRTLKAKSIAIIYPENGVAITAAGQAGIGALPPDKPPYD